MTNLSTAADDPSANRVSGAYRVGGRRVVARRVVCVCLYSNNKHRQPPLGSSYVGVANRSFFVDVLVVIVDWLTK